MEPERAREVLESVNFVPHTEHTLTSVEAVMDELPEIRKEGVAEDREEAELGVRCLSVPIFDRFGHAVAALSLSFPMVRYDAKKRAEYVRLLHEAGKRISDGQGFHEYSFEAVSQTSG